MNEGVLSISVSEIKAKLVNEKIEGLENQLKAAMKITKDHWLVTDESQQFKSAIAGVMALYGPNSDEWDRLVWESKQIEKLNHMVTGAQLGIPINLEALTEKNDTFEPIGLLAMWKNLE
jgi:hypothetical protein